VFKMQTVKFFTVLLLLLVGAAPGCSRAPDRPVRDEHSHYHEAPHGGTMVVLGPDDFHIEFVRDADRGVMQAYLMDGHMHQYVLVTNELFSLTVRLPAGETELVFRPVRKEQEGAASDRTALFEAEGAWLREHDRFEAVLKELTIRGKQYEQVVFRFPEGNEAIGGHRH
jgi:hypothetical protein